MSKKNLRIQSELETIYIDSGGGKHLKYKDALCAETQIIIARERKLKEKEKVMDITELIMQILKSQNWGVYYKNQPIQPLELQDGNSLYQVNQVDDSEIEIIVEKTLAKDKPWESSQINSSQNNNSTSG